MATALPRLIFSGLTIPPAKAINAASGQRAVTVAADRAVVPVTYGQDRVPALILNVLLGADPTLTLIQAVWGHAVSAIASIKLNGAALPSGASATNYTGSQTTPDSDLVAAFAAQGITYTDDLEGYAYSVVKLPTVLFTGQLELSALIDGRKVYDPRKDSTAGGSGSHRLATPSTWEYSDCPSLCLADWIASTAYGAGETVLWSSVPAAANANDALIGSPSEKRRTIGLTITSAAQVSDMAEALRAYAGCWLVSTSGGIKLLPDADAAPVATYSHSSGEIASITPLNLPDRAASPTVVEVIYTDLSTGDRRDESAEASLPGVGSTLPYRRSTVKLPGISRYSQAKREAIERLNKLTLEGVATTLEVFDIGVRHERGDIIEVTHPIGLTAADMRVVYVDMASPGRWLLDLMRHDPLAYSDDVQTTPSWANTDHIINPDVPADVTNLQVSVRNGFGTITCDPCATPDYRFTEFRLGDANWGNPGVVPLHRADSTRWHEPVTTPGTYTVCAKHFDRFGQESENAVCETITITAEMIGNSRVIAATATPFYITVSADASGNVTDDFTGDEVTLSILVDGVESIGSWTLTPTASIAGFTWSITAGNTNFALTGAPDGWTVAGIDIVATRTGFPNQLIQLHIQQERAGGGAATISRIVATPPSATLSIDQNGVVTDWTPAQTDITVVDSAGVDETADWTYSIVTAHNVVAALSGTNNNHLTVTAWTPDAAGAAWGNTVLQLSFDNDSFADVSQYHRSPTDFDGVTYVTGAFGKGASFAGASASANRGYFEGHSSFISSAPGGQWSLRCRVKFTTLPAFGTNGFYILGNAYRSIRLSPNSSSQHRFEAQWVQNSGGGTLAAYQTYTTLSTGVWYLVEASYGSDGHLRLFVDGVLAGITSSAVTGAFDYIVTSGDAYNRTDAIVIGAGAAGGSTGLDGVIDDLRYVVGPGGNNSAYTPETYPLPIGAYATQGYVDVLAEHATKPDLTARFPISTVVVAAATVSSGIGPSSITLQADWQGVVSSFSGASAVLSIMVNGTEQADLWTITSTTSHASITYSKSGRTITLTGFPSSETTGYIDFFASFTGRPSQVIRLAISKVNAAQPIVIATPPAAYYIAGSTDGSVPSASLPVSRAFSAAAGATDVTSSYTWSATATSGITIDQPTANGPTFRVTAMDSNTDVGTITATGTRSGYPNLTAVASVVKTKNLPVVGLQTSTRWTAQTVAATVASGTATAGVRLADNGGIQTTVDGTTWTDYAPWYYPITSGIGSSGSYVVTALLSGASLDGGSSATGSQLALSSTRTWTKSRSTSGFEESVLTIIVGDTTAPNRFVWQVNLKVNVA